ncbi:MAG: hypothetical protein OXU68_11780 [Bacteroidota bacterium]|nr:hypothetical protein [Bacteroidota bacterium]
MNLRCTAALLILAAGCQPVSPYEQMRRTELARADTVRELFLNYTLGMSQQAFYDSSWALNRRGLVMQGPRNQNVQYKPADLLPFPATMLFYPDFTSGRMARMRILFQYDHWAPWNTRLSSDSLLLDVTQLMTQWYGGEFLAQTLTDAFNRPAQQFVSIRANREIRIGLKSDQEVFVHITDLRNPPTIGQP